jgi:hypothetical protein
MTLEVRPFRCSNGNQLVLVKDGKNLILNKLTEKGNLQKVAEKSYFNYENKLKTIDRRGFDCNGKIIRNSCIPVYLNINGATSTQFTIEDGKTLIIGSMRQKLPGNNLEFKSYELVKIGGRLKTLGNLAKRYLKKAIGFCSKVR